MLAIMTRLIFAPILIWLMGQASGHLFGEDAQCHSKGPFGLPRGECPALEKAACSPYPVLDIFKEGFQERHTHSHDSGHDCDWVSKEQEDFSTIKDGIRQTLRSGCALPKEVFYGGGDGWEQVSEGSYQTDDEIDLIEENAQYILGGLKKSTVIFELGPG